MLALVAMLLIAADDKPHAIQGKWQVVELKSNDQNVKGIDAMRFRLTFTADKMLLYVDGKKEVAAEWSYKLDDTLKPKLLDIVPKQGPFEGQTREGLYELSGDDLKFCLGIGAKERPTSFEVKPTDQWLLVVLKREKE